MPGIPWYELEPVTDRWPVNLCQEPGCHMDADVAAKDKRFYCWLHYWQLIDAHPELGPVIKTIKDEK